MSVFGLDIKYVVNGVEDELALEHISVAFERAGDNIAHAERFIFPKLGPVFEGAVARQFDGQGQGPHRGQWVQLADGYARWKAQHAPGAPILVFSGKLREALTQSNSPFAMRVTDGDKFNFGTTNVPYASFHQTGTYRMPDRPPFDFGPDFEREVQRAALEGVREAVREAGAGEVTE